MQSKSGEEVHMVDPSLNQAIADLGVSLTVMAAKGTATSVAT